MKQKIRVAIADDHQVVLSGVQNMLNACEHIELCGQYRSGRALLDGLATEQPDVLLLDIQMPDKTGDELAKIISRTYPKIRMLALTVFDTPFYIRSMMQNGCQGYLLKNTDQHTLIEAIETLYNNGQYIEPALKEQLLQNMLRIKKQNARSVPILTKREKDILQLIVAEHTSQEIADKLYRRPGKSRAGIGFDRLMHGDSMRYKRLYISAIVLSLCVTKNCIAQTKEEVYRQNKVLMNKKDSTRTAEKREAVAKIEQKYHTVEKDKQLLQQQILLNRKKDELRRKDLFLIVGSGVLLLSVLFLIIVSHNYRHRSKLDKKELEKRKQQREIDNLKAMMLAEEKERLQLARSIQNGIAQKLTLLNEQILQMPGKYVWLAKNNAFKEVMQQMKATEHELKQTTQNLAPELIMYKGIYKAVAAFCNSLHQSTGLSISCSFDNEIPVIEAEIEISLYRIIQELIQNIIKHAAASKVSVLFSFKDGLLMIAINDNGTGFANTDRKRQDGIGLKNIDARVKALGGAIAVTDNTGGGVTTHLEMRVLQVT